MRRVLFLIVFTLVLAPISRAGAADTKKRQEIFQERLEYDPKTGQWKEIAPPIPGTEEGDLALARARLAKGEFKEARTDFAKWFKSYPQSLLRPEALFYAAETEVSAEDQTPRSGDLIKAHEWLSELIDGWRGSEMADRGIRKEIIIAEMLLFKHRKQKIWKGTLWLSATDEAISILNKVIDDWARETPTAEMALRLEADYYYINGEFEMAERSYSRLSRDFPKGRYVKFALLRSGQSAFGRFPGVEFDEADLLEAEVYLKDFQARYPQDAAANSVPATLTRISDSRAEKDFRIAQYYDRSNKDSAAIYYYRNVIRQYAGTSWASRSHNRLVALGVEAADNSEEPATSQPVSRANADD